MKNLALLVAALIYFAPGAYAQDKVPLHKKALHVAKKVLVFPVYIGGGAVMGGIAWWHLGGHEKDLSKAFTGN